MTPDVTNPGPSDKYRVMDHAARRRLIYLLLRNGEIGGQPQGDDAPEAVVDGPLDESVVEREERSPA